MESHVLVLPLPLQGHINPMLQFSKRLASKGLKVMLIITPSIAKSMQGQDSSINLEPIFDGSKEGEMAANIDKYFERYKLTIFYLCCFELLLSIFHIFIVGSPNDPQ